MNIKYIISISSVTALGGFLFGFDTAVISGANLYIQSYFELDDLAFGFVVSSMLIGCALGALGSGTPSSLFGRKKLLLLTAILFAISAVGSGLATTTIGFIIYRVIGGLGVGAASMLAPLYIAEVSPAKIRGKMVSLNQLAIVLGVTVAFFSNYFLSSLSETVSWRWMLGVEVIPAIIFFILLFFVPESPRWLISKGKLEMSQRILTKINGKEQAALIEAEIESSLKEELKTKRSVLSSYRQLFKPAFKKATIAVIILASLQQLTGINIIMYYAPNIFENIGIGKSVAIFQSISIGFCMSLFTIIAMFLVDKIGRKKLLKWGSLGMALSLFILGIAFSFDLKNTYFILFLILSFIAFFSLSAGPIIWVLISEMLPNEIRSAGISIATFFLWITNYLVSLTFPVLLNTFKGRLSGITFSVYGIFCLLLFYYAIKYLLETKGKTLEEIKDLIK
ncbi:sugar porter family MFS transporter [Flavivirga rizhaonensis]|uniref:MFS transporter n=1 Tax=Flavivirga rizhaonensis TaxID=2559571 RepID=A0A4S1DQW0_9FLAO|nr:sugar porter family MFS transporter [Flavivirga rizhaonensis]TGV00237.1 MFS transporter [Flavivirga rizhaonensis]